MYKINPLHLSPPPQISPIPIGGGPAGVFQKFYIPAGAPKMFSEKQQPQATTIAAKEGVEESAQKQNIRIRITMTSRLVKNLEQVSSEFITRAKERELVVKGPVRMPTKVLRITTRKTPCGEGSKTWDRFEMRIHKRVIDIVATPEVVKQITSFKIEPNVDIDVTVSQ